MFMMGIGGTILVSHLSYKYIESWFLKKKEKFMLIKSRNTRSEKPLQVTEPDLSLLKAEVLHSPFPGANHALIRHNSAIHLQTFERGKSDYHIKFSLGAHF